jgi:hypothetical protein
MQSPLLQLPDKPEFLSPEEVSVLTGRESAQGQIRWLDENTWTYSLTAARRPVVSRLYAQCRMMGIDPARVIMPAKKWELDLSKVM